MYTRGENQMFNKKLIVLLAAVALFALVPFAVQAQEPTEEPPVVTVEQAEPNYYMLIVFFIGTIFSSVLVGGGSAAVVMARLNASKESKDTTESLLSELVPQRITDQMHDVSVMALNLLKQFGVPAAEFVRDVTDRQPNNQAQG
jgi:predicted secreted protein